MIGVYSITRSCAFTLNNSGETVALGEQRSYVSELNSCDTFYCIDK